MNRFRVRAMHNTYGDAGPDLLRPQGGAERQVASVMGAARKGWFTRRNPPHGGDDWTEWKGPVGRGEVLQLVEEFYRTAGQNAEFQVGRKSKGKLDPKVETRVEGIRESHLPNTNLGAQLVASLFQTQWTTQVEYLGGFSCREYNGVPGSGWSDHAWGDAVDMTISGGSPRNDVLMDWFLRMAREGCVGDVAQFIGSRDGRVYTAYAPDYRMNLGGASSHLTHVHASYRQHYGRDPGCS